MAQFTISPLGARTGPTAASGAPASSPSSAPTRPGPGWSAQSEDVFEDTNLSNMKEFIRNFEQILARWRAADRKRDQEGGQPC